MINKKAQEGGISWFTIGMVFGVICLIVLTIIVLRITGIWGPTVTTATCETSVYLRSSALAKGTILTPEMIPLKCATQYKCYTLGGKCPTGYEKVSVISDQDIKQNLADEMYSCWKMLGEGKIQFVDDSFVKEQVCLPCAVITFDDKLKGKQIKEFQAFLNEAKTPNNITYIQYFTNAKEVRTIGDEAPIDTSKDQVILFSLTSASNWKAKIATGTGAVAGFYLGCKGGGIAGTILIPIPVVGTMTGVVIGCAGGALGGAAIAAISSYVIDSWMDKKIIPSISLNEYSAESFKDCKRFESI